MNTAFRSAAVPTRYYFYFSAFWMRGLLLYLLLNGRNSQHVIEMQREAIFATGGLRTRFSFSFIAFRRRRYIHPHQHGRSVGYASDGRLWSSFSVFRILSSSNSGICAMARNENMNTLIMRAGLCSHFLEMIWHMGILAVH